MRKTRAVVEVYGTAFILFFFLAFAILNAKTTGYAVMGEDGYPMYATFDGNTTDFIMETNISCVEYPMVEKSAYGAIQWFGSCVDMRYANLDRDVNMSDNHVGFNVHNLSKLNMSIGVIIYGVDFQDPVIKKDGLIGHKAGFLMANTLEPDSVAFLTAPNPYSGNLGYYSIAENSCSRNGICEVGEYLFWCPDCMCNFNGLCETFTGFGENRTNCGSDCGICNNNTICEPSFAETRANCAYDCIPCDMNGICSAVNGETRANCADCQSCNNNTICETGETAFTCPLDCPPDVTPPVISGVIANDIQYNSARISFYTDEGASCELRYGTSSGIYPNIINIDTFPAVEAYSTLQNLYSSRAYFFRISCIDISSNQGATQEFSFTTAAEPPLLKYPRYTKFDGATTDFINLINIDHVYEATLEIQKYGKIEFQEYPINFSYANLDAYVRIEDNFVFLDTAMLPKLNKIARVYMYNISLSDPGILRSGNPCPLDECDGIVYLGNTLSFTALKWGYFQAREKMNFTIWDSTVYDPVGTNETITYYADFRYLGKVTVYDNVTCNISFPGLENPGNYRMDFDYHDLLYEFVGFFSYPGTYNYRVICNAYSLGLGEFTRNGRLNVTDTTTCGDGKCIQYLGENCTNCPADCGKCPKKNCTSDWTCGDWGSCVMGRQTRVCILDDEDCRDTEEEPATYQECQSADLCNNGIKDTYELDVDCGGPCGPCESCYDKIQNQDEEDVDCGGICLPCETCEDGIKNQGEREIDCGGPCPACPSCFDRIQNQGEEDIDCGGPCPACKIAVVEKPEDLGGGIPWPIVIPIGALVIVVGGVAGLYFVKPSLFESIIGKFKGVSVVEPTKEDDAINRYVYDNLKRGYNPQNLRSALVRSGWSQEKVDRSIKDAVLSIYAPRIAQLEPIIRRMDLRRPDLIYSALVRNRTPAFLAKAAIEKVTGAGRNL